APRRQGSPTSAGSSRTRFTTSSGDAGHRVNADPGSSRASTLRTVAAENHLLLVAWLVLLILLLVVGRELLNVDSWLTLVSGREIVEHRLPHRETLTVIPAGREWIDQQWLAQLLFYGLVRVRGLGLALLVHALLV